jgi:hypothetical protein
MTNYPKPIIEIDEHFKSVVFEKKVDLAEDNKTFTLEEQMVNYSNEVLGIKVMSVSLPLNYNSEHKSKKEVNNWLQNKIKNNYASAYILASKHGEKLEIKLELKEPYNNN